MITNQRNTEMKNNALKFFILTVLLVLSACDEIKRIKDIPLGTGHSAHDLCSRIFISNQSKDLIVEQVLVQKVFPLQWIWSIDINKDEQFVSVGAPFFSGLNNATAIYRQGQGCTLTHGKSIDVLRSEAVNPAKFKGTENNEDYWPMGNQGVHPDSKDYKLPEINAVIEEMFTSNSSNRFEQLNTHAVLVVHDGKLIAERYSDNHDYQNRLIGWSISKSVTALLMGIPVNEEVSDLSQIIKLNNGEAEKELRLKHVFNMASGLDFDEGYETQSDIAKMLYVYPDASAYAKSRPFKHEPGRVFYYSTGDTQILSDFVKNRVGGSAQAAHDFYQKELFHKLGIRNAEVEHDAAGTFIGGARMFMRPRDWAKIGLLMLNEGEWEGEAIVSKDWIESMLEPSPANPYYGGQVWLYDPEVFGERFPNDAYALWGVLGQLVIVVPSKKLIIVRMGANGSGLPEDIETLSIFKPALDIVNALN